MTRTLKAIGLALAVACSAAALAGCGLYFGNSDNGDSWSYCAADGYYVCNGNSCRWVSERCPQGTDQYACESDRDCAAGCYCEDGICQEAGFCAEPSDCPAGYTCDDRQSCVPERCNSNDDCLAGQVCSNGLCETTCVCQTDADAQDQGYAFCDETRGTCEHLGPQTCQADLGAECATPRPQCAVGEVALYDTETFCYTGECSAITACDLTPGCKDLQHVEDCVGRPMECGAVSVGLNCTTPGGAPCQVGDTNCTCAEFRFERCDTLANPNLVRDASGRLFDATPAAL